MTNWEEMWEDEEKERKEFYKSLGKEIGYDRNNCINCGRQRVIRYSSGRRICEKCAFDQDKKEYETKFEI